MKKRNIVIIIIILLTMFITFGIIYVKFISKKIISSKVDILGISFDSAEIEKIDMRTYFDNGQTSTIDVEEQINEVLNMLELITEKAKSVDTEENYDNGEIININIHMKTGQNYVLSILKNNIVCNNNGTLSIYEVTGTDEFSLNIYSIINSNRSSKHNDTLKNYTDYVESLVVYEGLEKNEHKVTSASFGSDCMISKYIKDGILLDYSNGDIICTFLFKEPDIYTGITNNLKKQASKVWNCKEDDLLVYAREGFGVIIKTSLYEEPLKLLFSLLKIRYGNI